ncbi:phage tail protein [Streptomyces durbertensis]|uniref:Phage tail protein n=1 Tax=Streptomyces durbertensis TaxID=2448886 RepID=A0ABR6EHU6_9ACTN|nr:phage tail protein [Streptomyces durbertensis]
MSYLRSSTATGAGPPRAAARLRVGVPGYAHPLLAPVEWAELGRPGLPLDWVALNVAGGPGDRPDPYCGPAVARVRSAGVPVLGLLDLRLGTRDFGELVSDAHHFLEWYGVDGFYLDRAPGDRAALADTERVTTTLRALGGAGRRLVLAPCDVPYQGFVELADQLVTFNGAWPDYRWSQAPDWTADHPAGRFCHLVHGVPGGHLDEALRIARWQGAGTVYLTDRSQRGGLDPWESLPGYWDKIVSKVGPGVSE